MTTKATAENVYARYEQDFDLSDPPPLNLLPEYLEMVIQYGVVVLFGAAFPLAPLFALINNIIEIRIDASKLVVDQRRVVPHQGCDIGSWQSILEFLTRLGILTNALIIAFTTDLIDRVVYRLAFNENHDLHGYLNFILAEFNTTDWEDPKLAVSSDFGNVTTCRYRGYFTHPRADKPYTLARPGWMVLLAKFGFLLVFQNLITWIQELIQYAIPDIPGKVQLHVQRNRYISLVAAHKFEKEKRQKTGKLEPKR